MFSVRLTPAQKLAAKTPIMDVARDHARRRAEALFARTGIQSVKITDRTPTSLNIPITIIRKDPAAERRVLPDQSRIIDPAVLARFQSQKEFLLSRPQEPIYVPQELTLETFVGPPEPPRPEPSLYAPVPRRSMRLR